MKAPKNSSRRKLSAPAAAAPCLPLKRVNYFTGQMLSAADFQAEQDYHRETHRRHNRRCHGAGIVQGLAVSVSPSNGGAAVVVTPGVAIDRMGNEVELCAELPLDLPPAGKAIFVVIGYQETPTDPVPVPGQTDPNAEDTVRYSRTEEGADVFLAPETVPPAIALARLVRRGKAWRVDKKFKPQRVC